MKKTIWLIIAAVIIIVICCCFLFLPVKYKLQLNVGYMSLQNKVEITLFRGKKYISENDLHDIIHIHSEYEDFRKIGYDDEESGIYMSLIASMESRKYIADKYDIEKTDIYGKTYLSLKSLKAIDNVKIEEANREFKVEIRNQSVSISPKAALAIGEKVLKDTYFEYDNTEYEISLYEAEDSFSVHKSIRNVADGGHVAKIGRFGEVLETYLNF